MQITFDGTNGEEIASQFDETRRGTAKTGSIRSVTEVLVNREHPGPALSLNRLWRPEQGTVDSEDNPVEPQEFPDSWRIPVGFSLDTTTGEVRDGEGRVWAYEDLVEL